jgi:GPH family glycoside/pentoside/hexuronide:cation symporter
MSTSQSIGSKIGIGFGSALTGWILATAGYQGKASAPTAAVINGIKFDFSWMGLMISVILFICILCIDVKKYLPEIRAALDNKNAAANKQ